MPFEQLRHHLLIWSVGLYLMGHAYGPSDVFTVIVESMRSLAREGWYPNELASPWYSWPFLYHPIAIKVSYQGEVGRYASSVGNPVLWFPATFLVIALPFAQAAVALKRKHDELLCFQFGHPLGKAALVLACGWFSMMLLFIVSMGKHTFFYHYQPSYAFALILLAGLAARVETRRPHAVLLFVGLVALAAGYFAPIWAEFAVSHGEAARRLIFGQWQPRT